MLAPIIHLGTDGSLTVGSSQDCTPILEHAKRMHAEGQHGSSEMRLAASIPLVLIEKYCNDRGITFSDFCADEKHASAVLNDPDLAHFRIWQGKC